MTLLLPQFGIKQMLEPIPSVATQLSLKQATPRDCALGVLQARAERTSVRTSGCIVRYEKIPAQWSMSGVDLGTTELLSIPPYTLTSHCSNRKEKGYFLPFESSSHTMFSWAFT